ncbi:VanZ family protein [Candidatus Woesearchaeota archaeon]|nr:VanZ family protein [Candidatus Woesearchaeota archaeon]
MKKYWLLALIWTGFIFYLSSKTAPASSIGQGDSLFGYIAHFYLFGILGVLYYLSLKEAQVKREYFLALILLIGYALFDETHQLFTPGRTFQIIDLAIDSFSGLIIFYFK